jgi:carboxymethylenebutenolidase
MSYAMTDVDLTPFSRPHGGSDPLHGLLARPDREEPRPGVVMIHEIFGLDDAMRRHAERLAQAGYLTLAVDLFSAGGKFRCLVSTMRALARGHGPTFADVDAARQWLAVSPHCTGKVGVIGFCLGGGFALLSASRGFVAAAANYGQLPRDLNHALAGSCPIVASYGGRDPILRNAARKLDTSLEQLGVAHDVKEYPTAGHAFLNESEVGPGLLRPFLRIAGIRPDPDAAVDAWRRIDAFFGEHLR